MDTIARDSIIITVVRYLKFIAGFGGIVVFSRILPPSELGSFFLFQGVVSITGIIISLGIDKSVEKKLSEEQSSDISFNSGLVIKAVTLFAILAVVYAFRRQILSYLSMKSILPIVAYLSIDQLNRICRSYHRGKLNIVFASLSGALDQLMWVTIGIGLVHFGWGFIGIVVGLIFSKLSATMVLLLKVDFLFEFPSYEDIMEIVSFSKYMYISSLGGELYNWIDILVLGLFVVPLKISGYELAWKITAVTLIGSKSIGTAIFPHISSKNGNSQKELAGLVSQALIGSSIFVLPAFLGVVIISEELISFAFGQQYAFASGVLIILMSEKVVHSIHEVLGKTLLAIGKVKQVAQATTINIILNIILNFILINYYGIVGAAIATSVSHIINTVILHRYIRGELNIEIPTIDVLWMVISSLVMCLSVYSYKVLNGIQSVLQLSVVIVGAAILYIFLLSIHRGYRAKIQSLS